MAIMDAIHKHLIDTRSIVQKDYDQLVADVLARKNISPEYAGEILKKAEKMPEDLDADVSRRKARNALRDKAATLPGLAEQRSELTQQRQELVELNEELNRAHRAKLDEIDTQLKAFDRDIQQAKIAEQDLFKTCPDDSLVKARRQLDRQRRELTGRIYRLRDELSSGRLFSRKQQLETAVSHARGNKADLAEARSNLHYFFKGELAEAKKSLTKLKYELPEIEARLAEAHRRCVDA